MGAVVQHRLAGLGCIRQDRGVHVDHHLIALPRGPRIELVMQRGFRQQGQRVRLLLRPGQTFTADLESRLRENLRVNGVDIEAHIEPVSEMPVPPTGKHRFVISEVSPS